MNTVLTDLAVASIFMVSSFVFLTGGFAENEPTPSLCDSALQHFHQFPESSDSVEAQLCR